MDPAIIEAAALQLPDGQRAMLADRLLESLHTVSPGRRSAWIVEAEARMDAYRAGLISAEDGATALAARTPVSTSSGPWDRAGG